MKNLSKVYQIYADPINRLKQFFLPTFQPLLRKPQKNYYQEFCALRNISLEIMKGEMFGIVGRNGAGKSTLLQLICGIANPTSGEITTQGRIAALLELGSGFNLEFTGHENIYIYGQILGLSVNEIQACYDEICAFADIGKFIDRPLKTYSSGMIIRLAFSVAINMKPDILIVDEALSVGDSAFQFKCMKIIDKIRSSGTTIIFTSHDSVAIKRHCDRAMWLHEGECRYVGKSNQVQSEYEDFLRGLTDAEQKPDLVTAKPMMPVAIGNPAKITKVEILNAKMVHSQILETGSVTNIKIKYKVLVKSQDIYVLGVALHRADGLYICGVNTKLDCYKPESTQGDHELILQYTSLPLLPGSYYIHVGIFDYSGAVTWDFINEAVAFKVTSKYIGEGICIFEHSWHKGDDA